MFIKLCDKYKIKLPLRTRGWCLRGLRNISPNEYQYSKNPSSVIFKYAEELNSKITALGHAQ